MRRFLSLLTVSMVFFSCSYVPKTVPLTTSPPKLNQSPPTVMWLRFLPPPKKQIPVAVYNFRDKTGQYKIVGDVSTFSNAVTQGAASILIKALEDSGWFIPVERENLADVLTERRIIRNSIESELKKKGLKPKGDILPPLTYAPIILTGGIISYDTDVVTGGAGARYFGVGGNVQIRKDQVTVYVRAVAAKTGKVLMTVTATKTILSRALDLNAFRYVKYKRLFELETGATTTEPAQYCVQAAIEKAVYGLIVEGIIRGYWEPKDPKFIFSPVVQAYLHDKTKQIIKEQEELKKVLSREYTEKEIEEYLKEVERERGISRLFKLLDEYKKRKGKK